MLWNKIGHSGEEREMDNREVIYYTDELHDEFSTFTTNPPYIDGSYDYERKSWFKKFMNFLCYRVIMYPIVVLYGLIVFRQKIVGRKKLKPFKKLRPPLLRAFVGICVKAERVMESESVMAIDVKHAICWIISRVIRLRAASAVVEKIFDLFAFKLPTV